MAETDETTLEIEKLILETRITDLQNMLDSYINAINVIDDFFEYSNESISDRQRQTLRG